MHMPVWNQIDLVETKKNYYIFKSYLEFDPSVFHLKSMFIVDVWNLVYRFVYLE